jgi:hypothetical protein
MTTRRRARMMKMPIGPRYDINSLQRFSWGLPMPTRLAQYDDENRFCRHGQKLGYAMEFCPWHP